MMDKGSENFVSAFAFGYFCLRENKMLFLQYGNDEDEEIFLRLAFFAVSWWCRLLHNLLFV